MGLDENEKSVYPFSMSRKKWQALALGMAVFVEMGSVSVKAAEDARVFGGHKVSVSEVIHFVKWAPTRAKQDILTCG